MHSAIHDTFHVSSQCCYTGPLDGDSWLNSLTPRGDHHNKNEVVFVLKAGYLPSVVASFFMKVKSLKYYISNICWICVLFQKLKEKDFQTPITVHKNQKLIP